MPESWLVVSKPRVSFVLMALLLIGGLAYTLLSLRLNQPPLVWGVLALVLGWALLTWLSLRIQMQPEHLEIRSLWGKRRIPWNQVASISPSLGPLSLNGLLTLKRFSGSPLWLFTAPFGNRSELTKALMDGAWRGNSQVRLDDLLTQRYGYPPFGRSKNGQAS